MKSKIGLTDKFIKRPSDFFSKIAYHKSKKIFDRHVL